MGRGQDSGAELSARHPRAGWKGESCEVYEFPYVYQRWGVSPEMADEDGAASFRANVETLRGALHAATPETAAVLADSDWSVLPGTGPDETDVIPRLADGVERLYVTAINNPAGAAAAQSHLPVMWDQIRGRAGDKQEALGFNHLPGGCNILFLDGHVEFVKHEGPWGGALPVNANGIALNTLVEAP